MRPRMSIKKLLKELPVEEVLLRQCLEAVHAKFGNSLGPVEWVNDAEDVRLGLIWQKRTRGVCLGLFPSEILAKRFKEPQPGRLDQGPETRIEAPEDLLSLLDWVAEAPKPGEWEF